MVKNGCFVKNGLALWDAFAAIGETNHLTEIATNLCTKYTILFVALDVRLCLSGA